MPSARSGSADAEARKFCCEGCRAVARLLATARLDREFYALKGERVSPVKPRLDAAEEYGALDEAPFRGDRRAGAELEFFLEGIHCAACVWILEKLPELAPGVESARLDFGRAVLRVRVSAEGSFAETARLLVRLGYRPHPVRTPDEADARLRASDRATLRRMGVAAFAAMNVMIYSISLYAGVDGGEATLFRALSLATALPALTYGAWPFYRAAWTALRAGRISIDLPISLAFIGGFAESARQAWLGTNLLYLDSVTSLVFLMLGSRYVLARLERAETSKSGLLRALLPAHVERIRAAGGADGTERVRAESLRAGERFRLGEGMRVPADAKVVAGGGYVDLAFLTGESKPTRVVPGDPVWAGSRFLDGEAVAEVVASPADSRLGRLQARLDGWVVKRSARTERSDRWAAIFLAAVLGFAGLMLALYGAADPAEAVRRSLSLLIIACPCALALATPLTLARAFRAAAANGILLRDPDVLDRVAEIRTVYFDKTGTLTRGDPSVREWRWLRELPHGERIEALSAAYTLEAGARHPYGRAIARALEDTPGVRPLAADVFTETGGAGRLMLVDGVSYRIGRPDTRHFEEPVVEFARDGRAIAWISLEDAPRREAADVVARVRRRGLRARIFSGDAELPVARAAREAGVSEWAAGLSPEGKRAAIADAQADHGPALAIGDGVNDALALAEAHVGAAVTRGGGEANLESALASAQVALLGTDLGALPDLFEISDRYRRTLARNAIFSALYNLAGASLAVSGVVHPLVAAIAMPVSALTVYASTVLGFQRPLRREGR